MKKYRRGSKIVQFVKRTYKHPNKTKGNIEQVPGIPSGTTRNCHETAIKESVLNLQQCTSNHEIINDQDELLETARRDATPDVIIFQTSATVLPSTSTQITKPSSEDARMALLNDDLYLTDSSDETVSEAEDSATSSSAFSTSADATKNNTNTNITEPASNAIPISDNRMVHDGNIQTNATHVDSATFGQQNRNRKRRQAVPSQWKKNIRKNKRQHGEPYLSAKGVLIPGKTLIESKCLGQCIHQCTSKFNEEERLKIFSSFWSISSVEQKRLYIVDLIHREKTKTLKQKQSRKKLTNKYFLKKTGAKENIRVCQKFFIATLNVSETFVRFCFKKVIDTNIVVGDKRGKHTPHNKKSIEIREHVRNHIKSFPRMTAPIVQTDTKKEYLGRNLNLTKMYKLYKLQCDSEQRESVELAYYRSVFNKDFNISFHRPGRNICDICLTYEQMNEEQRENEKVINEEHLNRIINARQHRDEAKSLAKSGEIHFVEYDLKAFCDCLTSSTKLKRTLPIYNFTVLNFYKDKRGVHCFCWHESIARKGAAEIGSCLYKYLQSNADGKPITFMSDTCASQCRNMYISSLLLYCIEMFDIPEINQKYYEQGHIQMETDNIHVTIEKGKKNKMIVHPSKFYNIIRKSLENYPNTVYEMRTDDFIDLKYLKNILIKNAKVDYHGDPVNWYNIRWFQYRKEHPNHIYFKYDLDDAEFNKIVVIRRGKRLQNCKEIVLLKKACN